MPLKRLAAIVTAAFFCGLSSVADAWDFQGHMAIGLATYDYLRRVDPALVAAVTHLAESLPSREKMDAALAHAAPEDHDRLTFAYLSRWPDDIRGTSLDRPAQHYRLRVMSGIWLPQIRVGDARVAYEHYVAVLEDAAAASTDKAIALAW